MKAEETVYSLSAEQCELHLYKSDNPRIEPEYCRLNDPDMIDLIIFVRQRSQPALFVYSSWINVIK